MKAIRRTMTSFPAGNPRPSEQSLTLIADVDLLVSKAALEFVFILQISNEHH